MRFLQFVWNREDDVGIEIISDDGAGFKFR
jgi:hypothetical protein